VAGFTHLGSQSCPHTTLRVDCDWMEGPLVGRPGTEGDGDGERYAVEAEIARGGHATVLRAHDRRLRRPVAIKQLRHERASSEIRFRNEALITARLQHPSIVPIYDVGTWADGTPYFAMELVRGVTLAERIQAAGRGERLALIPVLIPVSDAVAYAHSQGVVHRDLKPSNILVGDFGQALLIDWGIAMVLAEEGDRIEASEAVGLSHTAAGSVVGTPHYMPPEQAAGGAVDERADVYGLGAILYHLIAGRPPFADLPGQEVIAAVRECAPEPLANLPDVSPALVRLVERAMARDPGARHGSAAELRDELTRAAARRSSDRAPPGQEAARFSRQDAENAKNAKGEPRLSLCP
jgi:serine/threonine protein kinase